MSTTVGEPLPPSSAALPVQVGDVLDGKYKVVEFIGEGGMGVVVEAWHDVLEQRVAIKVLTAQARRSHQGVKRFLAEARSSAKVTSVHSVRVYDVGTLDNGIPFIVMEYLAGSTLAALVKNGPLPIRDVVDYILQACDAIADAHSHGIIHRDLKPENIFLATQRDGSNVVKVLDFGIAKALGGEDELTLAGHVMGTPHYMAPEQLRHASDVDGRTDIWSIGVILYRLLTARYPFDGKKDDLLDQIAGGTPPRPSSYRSEIPSGLEAVVLRCLEKDRLRRFRHVGELATSLAPYASGFSAQQLNRIQRLISPSSSAIEASPRVVTGPVQEHVTQVSPGIAEEAATIVAPTIVDTPPRHMITARRTARLETPLATPLATTTPPAPATGVVVPLVAVLGILVLALGGVAVWRFRAPPRPEPSLFPATSAAALAAPPPSAVAEPASSDLPAPSAMTTAASSAAPSAAPLPVLRPSTAPRPLSAPTPAPSGKGIKLNDRY